MPEVEIRSVGVGDKPQARDWVMIQRLAGGGYLVHTSAGNVAAGIQGPFAKLDDALESARNYAATKGLTTIYTKGIWDA